MSEIYALSSPQVVRLQATQAQEDVDSYVNWFVSYAGERFTTRERTVMPVIVSLHAGGPAGYASVSLGALFVVIGEEPDDLVAAIKESDATETLYDVARSHLLPILATVGVSETLPWRSPDAEIERFDEDASDPEPAPDEALGFRES